MGTRKLRIALLTSGRFHLCDLARELDARGHDVGFYSLVPPWRTRQFGLPDRCARWLGPRLTALWAASRGKLRGANVIERWITSSLDQAAARAVERCDVLIAMSGLYGATADAVRHKYGATVLVERGSRHILSQREILEACGATSPVPDWVVQRELADYDLADHVVVPAKHVVRSFLDQEFPEERLFRNAYGVDLEMFPPTEHPQSARPTIVMAGTWCLRKGCDVLVQAWRSLPGTRLIHVGSVGDAVFPDGACFEHHSPVDQRHLNAIYSRAHVFALASREEGLACVQAQALASGLPVVCSDRTGGEDLADFLEDRTLVTVVPSDDPAALQNALAAALHRAVDKRGRRDVLASGREHLSWRAYARRYEEGLLDRV
jgi:alpha-maltose-1-phosphate synthase